MPASEKQILRGGKSAGAQDDRPALAPSASWEELDEALAEYAVRAAAVDVVRAKLSEQIARITKSFEDELSTAELGAEALAIDLKAWAKRHKAEFKPRAEGGDLRSHAHAGVTIGFEKKPDHLEIAGDPEEFAEWLEVTRALEGEIYLRRHIEPDRQAIKAALEKDGSDAAALRRQGATIKPGVDKFFLGVVAGGK